MLKLRNIIMLATLLGVVLMGGCDNDSHPASGVAPPRELLLYCGTTMARAMRVIADQFENREHCVVKIISGGSGYLYRGIKINRVGDLYLPGSSDYIDRCRQEQLLGKTAVIGVNRAVLLVAKGNPLHISADLHNFINGRYLTLLADAESGSIGEEAKSILGRFGLYEQAVRQVLYLSVDSSDLVNEIAAGRADLSLNWRGAVYAFGAHTAVETIALPPDVAKAHLLSVAVLKYSIDPELAGRFVDYAASTAGRQVLRRFGLWEDGDE